MEANRKKDQDKLLATMAADRKADKEEMKADIKAWREEIAAETEAIKAIHSRVNGYPTNNRIITVAIKRRCKHNFPILEWMSFLRCPSKVVLRKSSEARVDIIHKRKWRLL
jgi:hypothetical protein